MTLMRWSRGLPLALLLAAAACDPRPSIEGTWIAGGGTGADFYAFRPDGTGRHVSAGAVEEFGYEIDYARDPVTVDLEMTDGSRRNGIVRFHPDGRLEIMLPAAGGERPASFSASSRGIMLRRAPTR